MALQSRINRRLALPFALAVVLASEVTGLALAVGLKPLPIAAPAAAVSSVRDGRDPATGALRELATQVGSTSPNSIRVTTTPAAPGDTRIRASSRSAALARPAIGSTASRTTSASATTSNASVRGSQVAAAPAASAYSGRNHVWIPTLGINRSISSFPCSRSRPPDNYVYRWGCAGNNNVYLLGHAYSVFEPLHDAYVGGRLKTGMRVIYADGGGQVTTYSVIWWKVTRPTTSASWAWAAQSQPSMTLQTCLGANSEFRLVVRLVAVD